MKRELIVKNAKFRSHQNLDNIIRVKRVGKERALVEDVNCIVKQRLFYVDKQYKAIPNTERDLTLKNIQRNFMVI